MTQELTNLLDLLFAGEQELANALLASGAVDTTPLQTVEFWEGFFRGRSFSERGFQTQIGMVWIRGHSSLLDADSGHVCLFVIDNERERMLVDVFIRAKRDGDIVYFPNSDTPLAKSFAACFDLAARAKEMQYDEIRALAAKIREDAEREDPPNAQWQLTLF